MSNCYSIADLLKILDMSEIDSSYNVSILQRSQLQWLLFLARHFSTASKGDVWSMEKVLQKHLPGGAFHHVSRARSGAMASVKGKGNRTTERRLRMALIRARIRGWKLDAKGLKGRPDIYFPRAGVVVFTDGCFWHGCEKCGHFPKVNAGFWRTKILRNKERDALTTQHLRQQGYVVIRIWEHELRADLDGCVDQIRKSVQVGAE
ncbi:MAG: very short patch repair endonuclease [Acidobacteria bacterium]|nr:very short patch repair endonuclease [Acidobacteriota bacterium]